MSDWARTCAKWFINEAMPLAKKRGVHIDELMSAKLMASLVSLKFHDVVSYYMARQLFQELSAGGDSRCQSQKDAAR